MSFLQHMTIENDAKEMKCVYALCHISVNNNVCSNVVDILFGDFEKTFLYIL